jgi:hypothetical protein
VRPFTQVQLEWIACVAIIGIVLGWGARDVHLLRRYRRDGGTGDQIFGSVMGLVMAALGAIGVILHVLGR